ncbi:MAG: adenylate cyclase [Flavobacteriaceae bacterium]|jgi:adenylate cyclase|nr:adenylate cyclase [Flavobacteriaceae bacterium]|tara:strand:- start:424 stop:879 length:456 start_codon:yes stop_codon:yes gene_type:complete
MSIKIETERKFIVTNRDYKKQYSSKEKITQAYLSKDPKRSVRIRVNNRKGWITIKGESDKKGLSRMEWEREIPLKTAKKLLKICLPNPINKIRYKIQLNNNITIEVDEFLGHNKGLVLAEIELISKDQPFEKPDWLGKEVTGIKKFYNSMM